RVGDPLNRSTVTMRLLDDTGALVREVRRGTSWRADGPLTFPFEAIPASDAREYRIEIESDAPASSIAFERHDNAPLRRAPAFAPDLARLFDPWLSRSGQDLPPPPGRLERYLDRHVAECVKMKRFFFLRLAHLADAIGRVPGRLGSVLSVGAGMGYQEAFLAG